jgi:NDP-sugar pyrophosphorylase family protein
VIGPEAVVRGSVIMENAHIGARAQVLDSIVASGGTVGTDAIVAEESICGFGAAVEDGASLIAGREPLPQE